MSKAVKMSTNGKTRLFDIQKETKLMPIYKIFNKTVLIHGFKKHQNRIENFQVRNDDVWVTSFPKSGTTWVQEMVWLLSNNLDYEGAKIILDQRCSFIESAALMEAYFANEEHIFPFPNPIDILDHARTRRFVKSHLSWDLLPKQIRNETRKPKIIHIIRDPKDVCVSYYHHTKIFPYLYVSMEEYFKQFISDKFMYGPYWNTVLSYWNKRHLSNVLIIRYEEMKKDLSSVIRKTADFLETSVAEKDIEKLVKHLSFEQMKNNNAVNFEQVTGMLKFAGLLKDKYTFMRKGKVGGYKEELNDDQIELLDAWCEANIVNTGLKFDI